MSDAAHEPTTPQTPGPTDDDVPSRDAQRPRSGGLLGLIGTLLGGGRKEHDIKESIEDILEDEEDEQSLSPKERAMLRNVLKFGGLKVADLATPRADIVAVEASSGFDAVIAVFGEAQHSRLPIYHETLDEPLGMIHVKDMIPAITDSAARATFDLIAIKRDIQFVTPSMPALDLLAKMQATHTHLALVMDEHGGTDGLISIEDLVEQIVGAIEDEHDTDEAEEFSPLPDGGFLADARLPIEEVEAATGVDLSTVDGEAHDLDTIGGLMAAISGHVPQTGEVVRHRAGLAFEVIEADPRRVKRVRIRRFAPDEDGDDPGGAI